MKHMQKDGNLSDIQLILTDLDGTLLLPDYNSIGERSKQALRSASLHGIKLSICTGRCMRFIPRPALEPDLFDYAITSNGAVCTDLATKKTVFTQYLSADKAKMCWSILQKVDPMVEWNVNGRLLLERRKYDRWVEMYPWNIRCLENGQVVLIDDIETYFNDGAPHLEKVNVLGVNADVKEFLISRLSETNDFSWLGATGDTLEITDSKTDKGTALRKLCTYLDIDVCKTLAFGDSPNDIALLSAAGYGVVVANGQPDVLAMADDQALSNEAEGVGLYIDQNILTP